MNNNFSLKVLFAANDNAALGLGVIGGIKSLLCDACGEREMAHDGLCGQCITDANAMLDERRGDWEGDRV